MKKTITILMLFLMSAVSYSYAAGCCEYVCQDTAPSDCPGTYTSGKSCDQIDSCKVGCCVDPEGYCYQSYLKGKCSNIQGNFYMGKECSLVYDCITAKEETSLVQSIGYDELLDTTDGGAIIISSGDAYSSEGVIAYSTDEGLSIEGSDSRVATIKSKETYNIYYESFSDADTVQVELASKSNVQKVSLYDDSRHDDADSNDNIFGGSFVAANSNGQTTLNVSVIVDGKRELYPSLMLYLTDTDCMQYYDKAGNADQIVLLGVNTGSSDSEIFDRLDDLASGLNDIQKADYYIVKKQISIDNINKIYSAAQQECDEITPDQVIAVDEQNIGCINDGKTFWVSGSIVIGEDLNSADMLDFCSIIEPQEYGESEPPAIEITNLEDNLLVNSLSVNLKITDDSDKELYYMINASSNGYSTSAIRRATSGQEMTQDFQVPDGYYSVVVQTEDSDLNYVESDELSIGVFSTVTCDNNIPCLYFAKESEGTKLWCRDFGDGYQWYTCGVCNGRIIYPCTADQAYIDNAIGAAGRCGNKHKICADNSKWNNCDSSSLGKSAMVNSLNYTCSDTGWVAPS